MLMSRLGMYLGGVIMAGTKEGEILLQKESECRKPNNSNLETLSFWTRAPLILSGEFLVSAKNKHLGLDLL